MFILLFGMDLASVSPKKGMSILHFAKNKFSFNFLWSKFVLLYPFMLRKKIVIMGKINV